MTLPSGSYRVELLEEVSDKTGVGEARESERDVHSDAGPPARAEDGFVRSGEELGRGGWRVSGDAGDDAEVGSAGKGDAGAEWGGGHDQLEVRWRAVDDGWRVVDRGEDGADGDHSGLDCGRGFDEGRSCCQPCEADGSAVHVEPDEVGDPGQGDRLALAVDDWVETGELIPAELLAGGENSPGLAEVGEGVAG